MQSLWFIAIIFGLSPNGFSQKLPSVAPFWQEAKVSLSQKTPIRSTTQVRVKVFPHKVSYPPHGRDDNPYRVSLAAPKGCQRYQGHSSYAGRIGGVLEKKHQFSFQAGAGFKPVFLNCRGSVKVIRGAGVKHFSYLGDFYIRVNPEGALEVMNLVPLNTYLKGVVPSEVYTSWPMETLKTQAVAARTYAVFHLRQAQKAGRRFFDVDDTVRYQAYTGVSLVTPQTSKAVEDTRAQILTFDGSVIQAYYHADSGGQTEVAEEVWALEVPYCPRVEEPYLKGQVSKEWSRTFSIPDLTRKLRARRLIKRSQSVRQVRIPASGRSQSGRVKTVSFELQSGGYKNLAIDEFRKLVGIGTLPSTLFELKESKKDQVEARGYGFGHGVGMSQTGAEFLARERNWRYDQILGFYYSGVELCVLDEQMEGGSSCYQKGDRYLGELSESPKDL